MLVRHPPVAVGHFQLVEQEWLVLDQVQALEELELALVLALELVKDTRFGSSTICALGIGPGTGIGDTSALEQEGPVLVLSFYL